jgi:environmental stress-induced protein Ves
MPFAMKMAARTRKHEMALQLHTPAVEPSESDRRRLAKHAALESFNVIWRDEMAKLAALRAESETLRAEIATASTPTVVTCAKCKQVITGCPRAHFREKHRGV